MNKSLRYLFFIMVFLLNTSLTFSQEIDFDNPPRQENTYLFTILRYQRQPAPPDYMRNRILQITENPVDQWTAQDSLYYAYKNVYNQRYEMALSIFSRLNTDTIQEIHAQSLYRTTLQHLSRYEMLEEYNKKTFPDSPSTIYSIKEAMLDLTAAYLKYEKKTFIPDSTAIFPILKDEDLADMDPDKSPNKNRLVSIAFAIDSAFRHFTIMHDKKDYILSQAFEEMADFQKKYFYLTNAYFYYSASRHYYLNDVAVMEKYNEVVDEMNAHNYISISFKNKFGKVIKNRYRMDKQIKKQAKPDSLTESNFNPPPEKEKRKDYLPWIDNSILIMIILGLALVFVVFFMKTKK